MRNFMTRSAAVRPLAALASALLFFSSALSAAGPGLVGSLRANGVVVTNSIPMPDGGTVRSGDSIATDRKSLAIITSAAIGRLEVRADSQARLASESVRLERGSVASSHLAVEAGKFTVRPETPGRAWFSVASQDGRLLVAAHRGNVIIAARGLPQVVVPEGNVALQNESQQGEAPPPSRQNNPGQQQGQPEDQSATVPQTPSEQPPSTQARNKNKRRKSAGGAAGATAPGWTIGSLSHATSIALVAGIGAAAVGAAAAVSGGSSGPSPSH
jgi:hypothetical protein